VRRAVFSETLIVKPVNLSDLPALVVAADECDAVGISDLEGKEEEESFDGVEATVDEIA
jgi:hypothetical protein